MRRFVTLGFALKCSDYFLEDLLDFVARFFDPLKHLCQFSFYCCYSESVLSSAEMKDGHQLFLLSFGSWFDCINFGLVQILVRESHHFVC